MRNRTVNQFLEYINTTHHRLHSAYEKAFWVSYMGDHSVDKKKDRAQEKRDAFRSNAQLKAELELHLKKARSQKKKALIKRLEIWNNFFSLFQIPAHAVPLRNKAREIESKIEDIRSKRKEGYTDPSSGVFVEASENKMRTIMRTHSDEAVRKACFEAMEKLPLDTLDLYVELIEVRNEYARLLGYEDFYDYKIHLDEGMSKKELFSIFDTIYEKTKYAYASLRELEKEMPGLRKPWNFSYMLTGDFTREEDQYFSFENVLSYWGRSFAALGIDYQKGSLVLDLVDRKGKYNNGFCHYPTLVHMKGSKLMPGSAQFTSNAVPGQVGSGNAGIQTVFHEAGHAADRLNSVQVETCINTEYPPSTVSWAETHSQFMDTISSSIEWKMRYAHNEKGEAYPFSLYEKKVKKNHVLTPLYMSSIHFVVEFERHIYECKNLTRDFVINCAREMHRKFFDRDGDGLTALNIPHIYSWESSAYYHGYGLADLMVSQWREYFFKKYGYIVDNPKVGKEMKKAWEYGSLFTSRESIRRATGKELSSDAFLRDVTLSYDQMIARAKKRISALKKVPLFTKPIRLNARITMMHGKKKIADNTKSFEDMDEKYKKWLKTLR